MRERKPDWFKIILHGICGAILGALVGLGFWAYWMDLESLKTGIICIFSGALIFGFLAAVFLDQFWEAVKDRWDLLIP